MLPVADATGAESDATLTAAGTGGQGPGPTTTQGTTTAGIGTEGGTGPGPGSATAASSGTVDPSAGDTASAPTTTTASDDTVGSEPGPIRLLVFTATSAFRHDSIPTAISAFQGLGTAQGWEVQATEDPATFTAETLAGFDVVAFVMTTGDVLDAAQQTAFEGFIQGGGGYVGVHSACDTEYDWPWYGQLVGAYFRGHPLIQPAQLTVEDASHPSTATLPTTWMRSDEWYSFQTNPRDQVNVLMTIDEGSYNTLNTDTNEQWAMGADHPMAWYHEFDGGRAFYTALGHTDASYAEPEFLAHVTGGIEWAARR